MKVQSLTIRGYKSLRALEEFQLHDINIIVGANGAGKSNFLSFFKLAAAMAQGNLQVYVQKQGGPYALLYGTRKITPEIRFELSFFHPQFNAVTNRYKGSLVPTVDNRLVYDEERVWWYGGVHDDGTERYLGSGHSESRLSGWPEGSATIQGHVHKALLSWKQYHFHDTSDSAAVKRVQSFDDNLVLKSAAENLAPYLVILLQDYPAYYQRIVDTIKLAAPFFGGFIHRPVSDKIELEWFEQRDPDTPYKAHVLSDGTLRFICLATLLMQPPELLPDTVLLDEPELGLHPYAINLLADMLKQVAEEKQVLVATQSVELLNCFKPEDVVVAERQDDATILKRLDTEELKDWLEDYTLGELWKRNIFGGRPA